MTTRILDHDECMRLLATQRVGRLAAVAGHHPLVMPVNFALDHGIIVFRSSAGVKIDAAQHHNVAFQVDEIDVAQRSGWSVLVTGMAETLSDDHSPGGQRTIWCASSSTACRAGTSRRRTSMRRSTDAATYRSDGAEIVTPRPQALRGVKGRAR